LHGNIFDIMDTLKKLSLGELLDKRELSKERKRKSKFLNFKEEGKGRWEGSALWGLLYLNRKQGNLRATALLRNRGCI
jgi:hypothetical protein